MQVAGEARTVTVKQRPRRTIVVAVAIAVAGTVLRPGD